MLVYIPGSSQQIDLWNLVRKCWSWTLVKKCGLARGSEQGTLVALPPILTWGPNRGGCFSLSTYVGCPLFWISLPDLHPCDKFVFLLRHVSTFSEIRPEHYSCPWMWPQDSLWALELPQHLPPMYILGQHFYGALLLLMPLPALLLQLAYEFPKVKFRFLFYIFEFSISLFHNRSINKLAYPLLPWQNSIANKKEKFKLRPVRMQYSCLSAVSVHSVTKNEA